MPNNKTYKPGELVFYHRIVYSYRNQFNTPADDSEYGYGIIGRNGKYVVPVVAYQLAAGEQFEYDNLSCRYAINK